jgi:hypothetical protein
LKIVDFIRQINVSRKIFNIIYFISAYGTLLKRSNGSFNTSQAENVPPTTLIGIAIHIETQRTDQFLLWLFNKPVGWEAVGQVVHHQSVVNCRWQEIYGDH